MKGIISTYAKRGFTVKTNDGNQPKMETSSRDKVPRHQDCPFMVWKNQGAIPCLIQGRHLVSILE